MATAAINPYNKYQGNGTTTEFSIGFPYINQSYIKVYIKRSGGSQTQLTTSDYNFIANTTIKFPSTGSTQPILAVGDVLTIQRETTTASEYDFSNQKRIFPEDVMNADDLEMQILQEQKRDIDRAVKVEETSSINPSVLVNKIERIYESSDNIDTCATNISSITTDATNISNINTVATNISNVNAVADNEENINAVNSNATNINAVNANKTNIDTCASNIALIQSAPTNAQNAANSASSASTSATNANIWAEGTDAQVQALGGTHSSKGWADVSAQGQIQSDWDQTDNTKKDFIKNKATVTNAIATKQDILQYSTMPTAGTDYLGKIVQYIGTTTADYTKGFFYECKQTEVSSAVNESLTVTQTAGTDMGSFTTDINVFKTAIGMDRTWTYQFSCIGKPRIVSVWKYGDGMETDSFTRDSTFDIAQLHQYGWIDDGNNWFFTNTEFPDETTIFYVGSTDEIGTPTNTNSGWIYMATTGRQTTGMGIWVIGSNEDPINLADYGIYCSSSGLIGDVLSVAYTAPALAVYSYSWENIDVNMHKQIGEIIKIACTSDYIPDGCLPCDGSEYSKSQFNGLWTNYLTSSPAKLLTCSYADYETDINTYGFCEKFAVDTVNETFKVPTLINNTYQGFTIPESIGVKGNGKTLGISNGSSSYGLTFNTTNTWSLRLSNNAQQNLGNSVGETSTSNLTALGVNTNANNSGLIAESSGFSKKEGTQLRYFVVVSNGQVNQASMDWSQWATSLAGRMDTNASNATATGKATISGYAMPSNTYTQLTTGASGASYTAPANGYFSAGAAANSQAYTSFFMKNDTNKIKSGVTHKELFAGNVVCANVPVKSGDVVILDYTNCKNIKIYFIYAVGVEP